MFVIYTITSISEKIFLVDETTISYSLKDAKQFNTYTEAINYFQQIEPFLMDANAQPYFIGKCSVECDGFMGMVGKDGEQ